MNKLELLIRSDMKEAMKLHLNDTLNTLRMVLGEIPRLNLKAGVSATDDQVTKIIVKLIKSETEVLKLKGGSVTESPYINLLKKYLPVMAGESEIIDYIQTNIDFSTLRNKMQAVGLVNKYFGSGVDGKMVAKIVQTKF